MLAFASVGYAGVAVPELVTDRPDQTESSETVRPGYVQFEFGWTHTEDDEIVGVTSDSLPETLIRVGILDNVEFRFGFDGYIWEDVDGPGTTSVSHDGAGDLGIGLKWRLWEEAGWTPQTAVIAGTTLPTGAAAMSSERFDPSIRLACAHALTERLGLGYNVAANWGTEEDAVGDRDTKASVAYSAVLGIALTDELGTFVEFFGEAPTGQGKPANSIDTGLTYALADNLQVDVLGGVGISEAADDWFVGAGLVWRLPQ
jgi:hypothetical protein